MEEQNIVDHKKRYLIIFLMVAAIMIIILMFYGGMFDKETYNMETAGTSLKIEKRIQGNQESQGLEEYNPKIEIDDLGTDIESDPGDFSDDDLSGIDSFESEFESSVADEDVF